MRFFKYMAATLAMSVGFFGGCSSDSRVAGNSAETGSPELAGLLFLEGGAPAVRARVQCVPQNYNAVQESHSSLVCETETDSNGFFQLDSVPRGRYSLEAFHGESGKMLLVQGIPVIEDDSLVVTDTLKDPGSVMLAVEPRQGMASGVATILGTTILRSVQMKDGALFVDSLPSGNLDLYLYFDSDFLKFENLKVESDDTLWVGFEGDSLDKELPKDSVEQDSVDLDSAKVLDTLVVSFVAPLELPQGSDSLSYFSSDIPLALRLTPENCKFDTLAGMTGRWEVSRLSPGGNRSKKLPINSAYFDTIAQEAVFWVNIDSLNVSDSLELTFDSSLEPVFALDVFPTNRAYSVVWHYDSGLNPVADDAEKNYFKGSAAGASLVDGVVGSGVLMKESSYIVAENSATFEKDRKGNLVFDINEDFCFSLWVSLESLDSKQTIFEKGDKEYALRYEPAKGFVLEMFHQASEEVGVEGAVDTVSYLVQWASGDSLVRANQWTYIAFAKHAPQLSSFFIDNHKVASGFSRLEWDGKRGESQDFKVGGFAGKLDELMVGANYRSDSWTYLTYLNQSPQNYWPVLKPRSR